MKIDDKWNIVEVKLKCIRLLNFLVYGLNIRLLLKLYFVLLVN